MTLEERFDVLMKQNEFLTREIQKMQEETKKLKLKTNTSKNSLMHIQSNNNKQVKNQSIQGHKDKSKCLAILLIHLVRMNL